MVPHNVGYILDSDLLGRLDPQRKPVVRVISHRIVKIVLCVSGGKIAIVVLECETALAEDVECAPDSGLASPQCAEIGRTISIAEAEFAVISAEPSLFAGELYHVVGVKTVFRIVERECFYTRLVRVAADISVRDSQGNPYGSAF